MSWKREPCRNYQRGSCRYGNQCKFLHVDQQQKPNNTSQEQVKPNPFGFGTGSKSQFFNTNGPKQQQKLNPFGFGVQTGSTSNNASAFGSTNQSHSQAQFGNKWIRPTDSTPQQKNTKPEHKCTDPESCKKLIIDDFKNERPMWTLSCYSHFNGLPCDITGDISFEELRVAAYDDAKRGLPMQAIVERERKLLSSKLAEYETLMRNPYVSAQSSAKSSLFSPISSNQSPVISQNNVPSQTYGFGEAATATATNPGQGISSSNNIFGQPTVFQASQQSSSGFESKDQYPGPFGGQFSTQSFGSVSGQYIPDLNIKSVETIQNSAFSQSISNSEQPFQGFGSNQIFIDSVETNKAVGNSKDNSIWLKDKWEVKEIPEEEPPPKFCI